ncbi:MAG: succinate dehydrogenase [Simkaniaceae bacterium]|nr:succinate dehydrogenase [Simkaniaceae bacterium]
MATPTQTLPSAYVWRRVHSLFGLLIALFLTEHLITNSQTALLLGADGSGFVRAVNFIHHLPFLPVIEIGLIGVPILFHAIWGIRYAVQARSNTRHTSGKAPSLGKYSRNQAYSWQRITSWILFVGLILHVSYMRFYRYPDEAQIGSQQYFSTRLSLDPGLYTVAKRLDVTLYSSKMIDKEKEELVKIEKHKSESEAVRMYEGLSEQLDEKGEILFSTRAETVLDRYQLIDQKTQFLKMLTKRSVSDSQVVAVAKDFGTATLLMVRDSFKSYWKAGLYSIFVLAAAFHGFNGLWTFLISWGMIIRMRSQKKMVNVCVGLMVIIAFLGLASVWGTYWINLKQ